MKKPLCAICLTGARSIDKRPTTSSLGPLIRLTGEKEKSLFALLYCAHTADSLRDKNFSFTRLHKVDGLTAKKYHSFRENEFHDLAVARAILPEEFCNSHLTKSKIKPITSANIGDEVRIISINNSSGGKISKIQAVNDASVIMLSDPPYDELIKLDIKGIPGDSGAPVISGDNELIGLTVSTDEKGYAYCNKLFDAKNLLLNLFARMNVKADLDEIYLTTQ